MKESYSQYRIRRLIASRKELMGQPEILEKNLKEKEPTLEEIAIECQNRNIDKIVMIGCGDSYFSGITPPL